MRKLIRRAVSGALAVCMAAAMTLPAAAAPLMADHDAILLANHGALTMGPDLERAYWRIETLEHTAQIHLNVRLLGGGVPLTQEQAAALRGG